MNTQVAYQNNHYYQDLTNINLDDKKYSFLICDGK